MNGYLSLGSNLGDRMHNLSAALTALNQAGITVVSVSDAYLTRAVEVREAQPPYLNVAAAVSTGLEDPRDLLEACRRIEDALGRTRPYEHAPRTIDIDILMLEGISRNDEALTVPHPRMEHRAFVIHPLAQIAPDVVLPSGRSAAEVKKVLGDDEIIGICRMPT